MAVLTGRFTSYSDQYANWTRESYILSGSYGYGAIKLEYNVYQTGYLRLKLPDFLASIPDGSTLDSISVSFQYKVGSGYFTPRLYAGWTENGTNRQVIYDSSPTTSYQNATIADTVLTGSPTQLMTDLKDGSLEVYFYGKLSYGGDIRDIYINDVEVTVNYTPSGPTFTRDGVAGANIGEVDGVAVASLGKVDGVA